MITSLLYSKGRNCNQTHDDDDSPGIMTTSHAALSGSLEFQTLFCWTGLNEHIDPGVCLVFIYLGCNPQGSPGTGTRGWRRGCHGCPLAPMVCGAERLMLPHLCLPSAELSVSAFTLRLDLGVDLLQIPVPPLMCDSITVIIILVPFPYSIFVPYFPHKQKPHNK